MKKTILFSLLVVGLLDGCSSGQKARREERDRIAQSKGVFCDFVSESDFKDVDVELNLRLAKKCDINKPFSISGYKRVSENPGVLYCCNSEGASESESTSSKASTPSTSTPASK